MISEINSYIVKQNNNIKVALKAPKRINIAKKLIDNYHNLMKLSDEQLRKSSMRETEKDFLCRVVPQLHPDPVYRKLATISSVVEFSSFDKIYGILERMYKRNMRERKNIILYLRHLLMN